MNDFIPKEGFIERIRWLIRLRWIAVIGVGLTVLFTNKILRFPLPVFPLYAITVFLGTYNLIFLLFLSLIKGKESSVIINKIANIQISIDLLTLSVLIHLSGGIENPFLFYFIFHMIIAGILLSRRASYMQATFAAAIFVLMVIFEYFGILPHHCLKEFIGYCLRGNIIYISAVSVVFISTLYIAVYMTTSISHKLRQREKALERANVLLKEEDRLKSEYVLRVSHNIKGHLAAIQGCLEPVAGGISGELNPKQLDLVHRAVQRTARLMFFVRALLEITRIKLSKELKMEYFSFKDLFLEAIASIAVKAKEKNIAVNFNIEPGIDRIRGAREYIQETIVNILVNGIKYTPCSGRIDINVKDSGNNIVIQISDTGIGIPKDELPRIFEEFYRASNAKEVERDGTGLGLSIAKRVVEMHNGKIWVESQEGKGSKFSIELSK